MENLRSKLRDEEWTDQQKKKDAIMLKRKSYFLPAAATKSDVECYARNCTYKAMLNASLSSTFADMSVSCKNYPLMICFSCNRTFHCVCVQVTAERFKFESVPWICPECSINEGNQHAVAFYKSDKWKGGMKARRKAFLLSTAITQKPALIDGESTDEELDPADESAMSVAYNMLQQEKQKSSIGSVSITMHKQLEGKVEEMQNQLSQILKLLTQQKSAEKTDKRVSISDQTQLIPPSIFSSTCVAETTTDILSQRYLLNDMKNVGEASATAGMQHENVTKPSDTQTTHPQEIEQSHGNLNLTETYLAEQVKISKENSKTQRDMTYAMSLELRRKSLPRIGKFSGEPKDWIRFKRDVQRWQEIGQFDEDLMKMYILQALEGIALERVQDMIDTSPLSQTMKLLEEGFGNPARIIERCGQEILNMRLDKELYREDVMQINTKIQAYFSACLYANIGFANTNHLAKHIFDQLNPNNKQFFRHHFRNLHPNEPNKLMDLESLFTFFEDLAKDLEDRKKGEKREQKKAASVMVTSIAPSSSHQVPRGKSDYMYEILDKTNAPVVGYDLTVVNTFIKKCECCSRNGHFTVQCRNYKAMDATARLKLIAEKGLCKNCVLTTTHRAMNCNAKNACGYRTGMQRCSQRHHITLHGALANVVGRFNVNGNNRFGNRSNRRNSGNANVRRANEIINNSLSSGTGSASTAPTGSAAPTVSQVTNARHNQVNSSATVNNHNVVYESAIAGSSQRVPVKFNVTPYDGMNQVLNVSSCDLQRSVKVFKNKFLGRNGFVTGYSVGDSAAEVTLVREDLRQALNIEGIERDVEIQWTDNSRRVMKAVVIDLCIQGVQKNAKKLVLKNCYAVDALDFPPRTLDIAAMKRQFPYLRNVKFDGYENMSPWLLIGSPHASVIESVGKLYEDGVGKPVGLLAKLGWTVYGGCPEEFSHIPYCIQAISKEEENDEPYDEVNVGMSNEELYSAFSFFSSIESLGISGKDQHYTEKEKRAIDLVSNEMRVLADGSIEVPLVWDMVDGEIPALPNNLGMVLKRQLAHEAKLRKNPEHLKAFNDNFKELLTEGYVRAANDDDMHGDFKNVWYLPMSLVVNANKRPVKYRNVFDASARFQGTSLNENLLRGPDLLVDLLQPLLRMRENRVAFTADIKSMFMRMKVNRRDQQCQRIIWRENADEDFRVYVMTSVLFGPTCSPFESQLVKNLTADKWTKVHPEAASTIKRFMYMDDLLSSEPSVDKAIAVAKDCIEVFESINWHLIAFQSNSLDFLRALPEANVNQSLIPLLEEGNGACTTKVLGCNWDTKSDSFVFQFDKNLFIKLVKELNHRPTKRDQSSTLARIFDVMGLIAHYTIRGKILLQRSWYKKLDWDEEISDAAHKEWLQWLNDIEKIAELKIPRMYGDLDSLQAAEQVEIHTFCDAGDEAFAAVSYMVVTVNGKRFSNIIMAKARVAPLRLKTETKITQMPRLELYAALIGARLTDAIVKCYPAIKFRRVLWSDSEVVLHWLCNAERKLLKYAIAPVEEILEKTDRKEWWKVPTDMNPADIATKFKTIDFGDAESVWFRGPTFIRETEEHWPPQKDFSGKLEGIPLVVNVNNINMGRFFFMSSQKLPPINCAVAMDSLVDNFSAGIKGSWSKLVRATARALKLHFEGLIPLLKSKAFNDKATRLKIKSMNSNFEVLSPNDLERAELFLIRKAQRETMPDIYKRLANKEEIVDDELRQLHVFMDSQGLIRIDSRVDLSPAIYPQRFAPLLPRKTALTRILLLHVHCEYKHVCLESQIAAVRAKFWIPQLRTALRSIAFHCNFCNLKRARPYAPLMAPLPTFRVDPAQNPFEVTGLDCAGPITVRLHTTIKEVYILIFSCTLTRFIHLHLLESLQTVRVLEAISQFWAAHGPVRTFVSDNGRNFVGAGNFLKEQNQILGGHLSEKFRCDWKFIPAHSPWMGGMYERLIKEVKRAVEHVLSNRKLQKIELNIALQDAAHRLNCRPLTHNAVAAEDEPVITPHHLAKGRSGWPLLPGLQSNLPVPEPKDDKSVYRRGRAIADAIMRKFVSSYLPELTKRSKWFTEQKALQVGDLVMIIEPNQTRQEWQRGRVVKLYKSRDRRSRVADVMRHDRVLKVARSVQRLAKIEIASIDQAC